jgi:hypothetical protein
MNYFYETKDLRIDPILGKVIGTEAFKGVEYSTVLHSATDEGKAPLASSYEDLILKAPTIAEEMIWTEIEVDSLNEEGKLTKEKRMSSIKDWRASGKPPHGPWYPRHVWLGIDPGFDRAKATAFAEGKELGPVGTTTVNT